MTKDRVKSTTPDLTAERLDQLRGLFPEAFTEGKVDFDKLRAALGDFVDDRPERYSFTWAGKQDAIRLLQTPSSATLVPVPEESVNWDATQNIFIEGDNLEVLKLLYKPYFGKVKLIYIDPPYNTGNDFVYPDDYADPLGRYLEITGQKDAAGNLTTSNPETSGRYHSAWLTMMYPRLFLARQLLREDGVIFISIDDTEVHNLRLLMNEIFGEENFIATIIWEKKFSPQNDARWLSDNHDYILLYARNKELWRPRLLPRTEEADSRYSNPDNDPRGPWSSGDLSVRTYTPATDYEIVTPSGRVVRPPEGRCWNVSKKRFDELVKDNRIWFGQDGNNAPRAKRFLSEVKSGMTPLTIWTRKEAGDTQQARRTIRELFGDVGVFDTPKPVELMKRILAISTEPHESDLVLDFFAGSCSMAHAVLSLNAEDGGYRRFLMVQVPEPTPDGTFATIADVGKERIRRAIKTLDASKNGQESLLAQTEVADRGFRVFALRGSELTVWNAIQTDDPRVYASQLELYHDRLLSEFQPENVAFEVALKEYGYNLNCQLDRMPQRGFDHLYRVTNTEGGHGFLIALDAKLAWSDLDEINWDAEDTFVCRDSAIDDFIAANLALQTRLLTL